jgi:hypothetical protein
VIPVLLAMLAATPAPTLDALYAEARRYDHTAFKFEPPCAERLLRLRSLAADLVRGLSPGQPTQALRDRAAAEGLELVQASDAAGLLWVLREAGGRRAGTGLYAFRPGGAPLCIQAPHTFFDEGTGQIALAAFAELRAGCLFVNTVHRHAPSAGGEGLADVAHAERSAYRSMTQGLLEGARWTVVQLHGFAGHDELGAGAGAVVSDGVATRPAGAPAARLRDALASRLAPLRVLLYGVDASTLGATTNVEGADVRRAGGSFLHLELSAVARRRLRDGGVAPLASALAKALEVTP